MPNLESAHNVEWDMKARLSFQVKIMGMMGGGDLERWINKYGEIFHDLLEEKPELMARAEAELGTDWDAPSVKESPFLREVADEIQSRYDIGKEAEPDEETLQRDA